MEFRDRLGAEGDSLNEDSLKKEWEWEWGFWKSPSPPWFWHLLDLEMFSQEVEEKREAKLLTISKLKELGQRLGTP